MSWLDRINAAIVRHITGATPLRADEHGIEQAGQRRVYADLQQAIAYRHPTLTGDDLAVALDFGDSRVVVISETDATWNTVLAAIDRHPRNRRPSAEWRLALIAGSPEARLELL